MKKTVFLYGALLALFVIILRYFEYRFLLRDISTELYLTIIAVLFTAIGIWVGLKIVTRRKVMQETYRQIDKSLLKNYKISEREAEVLLLMSRGLSNQEIANRLFVSLNTIKTHASNLYSKLGVQRRTQAIQKAQQLKLI